MGRSAHRRELQREREALIRATCGGEQGAGELQRDMREGTIGHHASLYLNRNVLLTAPPNRGKSSLCLQILARSAPFHSVYVLKADR